MEDGAAGLDPLDAHTDNGADFELQKPNINTQNPESNRIYYPLLNCDLNHIQGIINLRILRPDDAVWFPAYENYYIYHLLLLRDKYAPIPELVPVTNEQILAAIDLFIQNGFPVQAAWDTRTAAQLEQEFQDPWLATLDPSRAIYHRLLSFCRPLEVAIFRHNYPAAIRFVNAGAPPPRETTFLQPYIDAWNRFKAGQRNLKAFRQTLGNKRPPMNTHTGANPVPSEIATNSGPGSVIASFLTGLPGSQSQQKRRKTRRSHRTYRN